MANEFVHKSVGTQLTQAEFEAVDGHVLNSQATGDVIYASSATQLTRLGIGSAGQVLVVVGGIPAWVTSPAGEGHITIIPVNYDSIGAGTWAFNASASAWGAYEFPNTSNADLDNISYKAFLAAGTYTLRLVGIEFTNQGIVDVDIDGVEVASFDRYAAVVNYVGIKTATGIVVATSGLKTLRLRIDGKNASSTAYYLSLSLIGLWRTA